MRQEKQIFISYSSKDKILVEDILHKLEDLQIHIWKAPECIRPGYNYAREIPRAIRESALFLLFVSAASQNSIWVEKEVDTAVSSRVRIIPVQIDDTLLSDMYLFYLNNVQMISYQKSPENAIYELRQQIRDVILEGLQESLTEPDNSVSGNDSQKSIGASASEKKLEKEDNKAGRKEDNKAGRKEESGWKKNIEVVGESHAKISSRLIKTNELRKNKIPLYCEACGCSDLNHISLGIYVCTKCGHENYDDYTKIRNYMKAAGPSTVFEISRQTGVSRDRINAYFKERNEDYEERKQSVCKVCGMPVTSGNLCRNCASKGKNSGLEEGKRFRIIRNKS